MTKEALRTRLDQYYFDHLVPQSLWGIVAARFGGPDASLKAFAGKLCRKLHWSPRGALRAIEEYKRFVYLGVISDTQVTPSKIIDAVWHEHLLFTAGYRTFCEEVIDYNFQHFPELVPLAEQTEIFAAQYQRTLELYEQEFGVAPPAIIWDATKFDSSFLRPSRTTHHKAESGCDGSTVAAYQSDGLDEDSGLDAGDFGDGGDFGGAGASGSWDSAADGDSDSSGSDASDGGSDSGSSCSSGCGGGD